MRQRHRSTTVDTISRTSHNLRGDAISGANRSMPAKMKLPLPRCAGRPAVLALATAAALWSSALHTPPAQAADVETGVCSASETFVLAVHGGAVWGDFKHNKKTAFLEGVLEEGRRLLEGGASSLAVVHAAIVAMEDSGAFNAGKGANANSAGDIELDASIMDGATQDAGAVAAVRRVKNPIEAARLVMAQSRHVMMVGPDADRFAADKGAAPAERSYFLKSGANYEDVPLPTDIRVTPPADDVPPELAAFSGEWRGLWDGVLTGILVVERITVSGADVVQAHGIHEDWGLDDGVWVRHSGDFVDGALRLEYDDPQATLTFRLMPDGALQASYRDSLGQKSRGTLTRWKDGAAAGSGGTVGAVALDRCGNLAAGTSTGGFGSKTPGRVGDSPIIGAGTYAKNATAAISATGHGEYFIRFVVGHDISALMEYGGLSLQEAANKVVLDKLVREGGKGGVIAVDRDGNVAMPFNTDGMVRGVVGNDRAPEIRVY